MSVLADIAAGFGRGWLIGFVLVSAPIFGAVILRMIGILCGGDWSRSEPLRRLTAFTPWLCLIVLPALALSPFIWPGVAERPATVAVYLSTPLIVTRTAVFTAVMSLLAMALVRTAEGSAQRKLTAALGLVFYGVTIGLMATDWEMALQPPWISSAEPMGFAVFQLAMALAWTILLAPQPQTRAGGDVAGFLVATLVATLYFALVTYLIPWYGDLPDKTSWFRLRSGWLWGTLLAVSLSVGAFTPIVLIALGHRRLGYAQAYRLAGAFALCGLGLHEVWMMSAPLGFAATAWAILPIGGGVVLSLRTARALGPQRLAAVEPAARWDSVARGYPAPASFGFVFSEQPVLQRRSAEDETRQPEPLESPQVPWKPILAIGLASVLLAIGAQGMMLVFYDLTIRSESPALPAAFPSPRLEEALTGGSRGHPAPAPGSRGSAPPGIAAAQAAVVARGAHGYDPSPNAPPSGGGLGPGLVPPAGPGGPPSS
ncbi:MAG: hypothetical protein JO111_17565 [Caulobacteraceae bacterium]|nr:hypothetical protein [Caulobacteraceae bacterium]